VLPATRQLRAHPVLLVDSARGGVCNVTSLDVEHVLGMVLGLGPEGAPTMRSKRRAAGR